MSMDAFDYDTLGDDPAEFDEWLRLYDAAHPRPDSEAPERTLT